MTNTEYKIIKRAIEDGAVLCYFHRISPTWHQDSLTVYLIQLYNIIAASEKQEVNALQALSFLAVYRDDGGWCTRNGIHGLDYDWQKDIGLIEIKGTGRQASETFSELYDKLIALKSRFPELNGHWLKVLPYLKSNSLMQSLRYEEWMQKTGGKKIAYDSKYTIADNPVQPECPDGCVYDKSKYI